MAASRRKKWADPARRRRLPPLLVAAGLAAVLAAGLVAWRFWPRPPPGLEVERTSLELEARMIEALKPLHLVPVVVPRGQTVGDVYSADRGAWLRWRGECFGPIRATRSGGSDLPGVTLEGDRALGAALGVGGLLGASGAAGGERRFHLSYADVTFEGVSEGQLRASLHRDACPELTPLLDGTAPAGAERLLVVGEVYRATRKVEYRVGGTSEAKVEADAKVAAARRLGVGLKAEVKGEEAGTALVRLSAPASSVVAVRPAFIPVDRFVLGPGGDPPSAGSGADWRVKWEVFDPEDVEHTETFDDLLIPHEYA